MPNWTKEQQAAIDARGCNLLVAAAAGSGKTAVLVERITQLLLKDGVDIDRLLVVTFTNAAAGEMRERIGAALLKAIDEDIGEDSAHLRRQLNLLPKASISTIHSFCMQVIRKYFHVINLDPGFRIGDETECHLLKLEVMEEVLESEYEKGNPNFLGLVERFSDNRQDAALQELVLNLHSFTQSKPFPQAWLEDQVQNFALEMDKLDDSPWVKTLLSSVIIEIQGIVDLLSEALILCEKPFGPEPYRENILDDLQQINGVLMPAARKGLSALQTAWGQINFSRLKTCRKDAGIDEELKKKVRDLRERAKKALAGLGGGILKSGLEQNIKQLNELYPYMQYLCVLVK
ncbi:MAG: UvrD-helicase domain-containing protein [Clostridiales bacterium]|nr:UvrD-helicase domain-containing protein [Clostridiales bacterium]